MDEHDFAVKATIKGIEGVLGPGDRVADDADATTVGHLVFNEVDELVKGVAHRADDNLSSRRRRRSALLGDTIGYRGHDWVLIGRREDHLRVSSVAPLSVR